jgi:hypothetical protein
MLSFGNHFGLDQLAIRSLYPPAGCKFSLNLFSIPIKISNFELDLSSDNHFRGTGNKLFLLVLDQIESSKSI